MKSLPPQARHQPQPHPGQSRALSGAGSAGNPCGYFMDLVYERCRVRLDQDKEPFIQSKLERQYRQLGLASLQDYARHLRARGTEAELNEVVDALTTNFTKFLREQDHFDFLIQRAIPATLKSGRRNFRVWSAGCSSGEEPYTIALFLAEHYPPAEGWNWCINATDISAKTLAVGRRAVYSDDRVLAVPREWLRKYFDKGYGASAGLVRVKPELIRRIVFCQANLTEPAPHQCCFEAIFCRNVLIYFDSNTQERVIRRLADSLVPGGFLFTGHAESLNGLNIPLRFVRPSIYQKPCP